jgi:hypothetical protein
LALSCARQLHNESGIDGVDADELIMTHFGNIIIVWTIANNSKLALTNLGHVGNQLSIEQICVRHIHDESGIDRVDTQLTHCVNVYVVPMEEASDG